MVRGWTSQIQRDGLSTRSAGGGVPLVGGEVVGEAAKRNSSGKGPMADGHAEKAALLGGPVQSQPLSRPVSHTEIARLGLHSVTEDRWTSMFKQDRGQIPQPQGAPAVLEPLRSPGDSRPQTPGQGGHIDLVGGNLRPLKALDPSDPAQDQCTVKLIGKSSSLQKAGGQESVSA